MCTNRPEYDINRPGQKEGAGAGSRLFSVLSSQTLNSMIKASSIRLKYSLFQEINQLHLYGARPLAGHDIYPAI